MNKQATKCTQCKKAFDPVKIDQKYCSAKCRQAAYRVRIGKPKRKIKVAGERPLSPAVCLHCSGSFWGKTKRAAYCSTSCRTLAHRALKSTLPNALSLLYGLPEPKAADLIETQPIRKLRRLLTDAGFLYSHPDRSWVRAS